MEALLEPFRTGIGQRALVEVALLALACGPLGAWVILHRQSYAVESLSHGMLPGLVIAALAGVPLAIGAGAGVVVAALAIAAAGRDERLGVDAGVAVAVTALLGAGSLLALSPDAPARLDDLLFGDPLGVTGTDLALAAGMVVMAGGVLTVRHRALAVTAFDRDAAPSLGASPAAAETALLVAVAVITAATAQALGNLLAVALVLGPGAAGVLAGRRLPGVMGVAAGSALVSAVAGLEASHHLGLATGAAIALAGAGAAAAGAAMGALRA